MITIEDPSTRPCVSTIKELSVAQDVLFVFELVTRRRDVNSFAFHLNYSFVILDVVYHSCVS